MEFFVRLLALWSHSGPPGNWNELWRHSLYKRSTTFFFFFFFWNANMWKSAGVMHFWRVSSFIDKAAIRHTHTHTHTHARTHTNGNTFGLALWTWKQRGEDIRIFTIVGLVSEAEGCSSLTKIKPNNIWWGHYASHKNCSVTKKKKSLCWFLYYQCTHPTQNDMYFNY